MRRTWWKSGQFNAVCDVCGFKFKSVDLRQRWDGLMVCEKDFEFRHPQELIRPVQDQNKLPWTRPEPNDTYVGYGIEINPNPQIEFPPIIMETPGTIEPPGSPPVYPEGPMRVPVILPPTFTGGTIRPSPLWPPWTIFKPIYNTPSPPYIDPGGYPLDPPGGQYPAPVLEFNVGPSDITPGAIITPAVVVRVVGNLGIPITGYSGPVTLSIRNNPGSPAGTLSGTLTVDAVDGIAIFSDLSIDNAGTGYTLKASSTNLSEIVSNSFNVQGYTMHLSTDQAYNIYGAFIATFGIFPPSSVHLTVIVDPGVTICNVGDPTTASLVWSSLWSGSPTFKLINYGTISGAGGTGGSGGYNDSNYLLLPTANNGGTGGNAIELNGKTVSILNASGVIRGGGGGGGAGASAMGIATGNFAGGGGGEYGPDGTIYAGNLYAQAGGSKGLDGLLHYGMLNDGATSYFNQGDTFTSGGTTLTLTYLAVGQVPEELPLQRSNAGTNITGTDPIQGGVGGAAGTYATAGSAGSVAVGAGITSTNTPGTGGAAGKAINLSGGTAIFVSGGSSPNVLGIVS